MRNMQVVLSLALVATVCGRYTPDPSYPTASPETEYRPQTEETPVPYQPEPETTPEAGYPSEPETTPETGYPSEPETTPETGYPSEPETTPETGYPSEPETTPETGYPSEPEPTPATEYQPEPVTPSTPEGKPTPATEYQPEPVTPSTPGGKPTPATEYQPEPVTPSTPEGKPTPATEYGSEYGAKPAHKNICSKREDGTTIPVEDMCFEYYECVDNEAVYRECPVKQRFDQKTGSCVDDINCVTACPKWIKPVPEDDTKYLVEKYVLNCANGTYFDYRVCTCRARSKATPYTPAPRY